MSLASRGFEPLLRGVPRSVLQPGGRAPAEKLISSIKPPGAVPFNFNIGGARSYHLPTGLPRVPVFTNSLKAQAHAFISRVLNSVPISNVSAFPREVARSFHSSASTTIHQSLSLPTRTALGRPIRPTFFPKAPTVPRNTTHVGIGNVRNFCNSRHVFQNLVHNVPVSGRAFVEADLDIRVEGKKKVRVAKPKKNSSFLRNSEMMKQNERKQDELERYFPAEAPIDSLVYAILTVPLVPNEQRSPFPSSTVALVLETHSQFSNQSIRVASLFRRLDAANVWEKGASCECLDEWAGSGLCTGLRVRFDGWTEAMARNVLGDAGKGWCTLEEFRKDSEPAFATPELQLFPPPVVEPEANSFIMPTLDFSSAFLSSPQHDDFSSFSSAFPSRSSSPIFSAPPSPHTEIFLPLSEDEMSERDDIEAGWLSSSESSTSETGYLGFSSEFLRKSSTIEPSRW